MNVYYEVHQKSKYLGDGVREGRFDTVDDAIAKMETLEIEEGYRDLFVAEVITGSFKTTINPLLYGKRSAESTEDDE